MAHDAHIRRKAVELRRERRLSIDEIAERLALPRTTVYHWVKDIPLERKGRNLSGAQRRRNAGNSEAFARRRRDAYEKGLRDFELLSRDPSFRDFVCMYIGEGYKRSRNTVSVANSDPVVVSLCSLWMKRLAGNPVRYRLQHHADQDPEWLKAFWGFRLGVRPSAIKVFRKSNSGQLQRRNWRCRWGVISVEAYDTMLRARLQAWIDLTKRGWVHD